ncbi:PorP/SprF family type IX secretion system membrane protein [Mongoliitalea lutea]|uniref:Membrane protein n=1 Tax=Mongoliitalea lutea TaxID=849756 RepID=A0A8J3G4W5_9BACT|nr:membrane protein [Mongoliitalea lutea]
MELWRVWLKKILLLIFVLVLSVSSLFSQQLPQFSQYIFNGLHINPAYAGYKNQGYIQSTYRDQWLGFPGAPKTLTVTADLSANEGKMGFGLSLLNDQIGPTNTSTGMLTYTYRIQLGNESFLGLGVSAGASQYMIDGSMLNPVDANDPLLPDGRINLFTPNLNSGLFFHTPRFYAGISAFNMVGKRVLEREDISLAFHDFHYYLTAGMMIPLNEKIEFKPSFLIKEVKGAPTSYDINGMFLFFDRLWLGASYRSNIKLWNDNLEGNLNNRTAVAFIAEIFATDNLRLGYAYDTNLNVLDTFRNNSHELSVGYYLTPRNVKLKNPRWF